MAHKLRQKTIPGVLKVAKYQVLGRSIAGSFFVECLLREAGIDYDFIHISRRQSREESFLAENTLGRIPVLGWLFKKQARADSREELLIFISPRIINRDSAAVSGS